MHEGRVVMADSKRVFVQLAVMEGLQMDVKAPVMAFVMPTDLWLSVINEFLMVRLLSTCFFYG